MPNVNGVSIRTYGNYSGNYGTHCMMMRIGRFAFYFSYETLVAVDTPTGTYVHENCWGPTSGKHLNAIDGGDPFAKGRRLNSEDFNSKVSEVLHVLGADDK